MITPRKLYRKLRMKWLFSRSTKKQTREQVMLRIAVLDGTIPEDYPEPRPRQMLYCHASHVLKDKYAGWCNFCEFDLGTLSMVEIFDDDDSIEGRRVISVTVRISRILSSSEGSC